MNIYTPPTDHRVDDSNLQSNLSMIPLETVEAPIDVPAEAKPDQPTTVNGIQDFLKNGGIYEFTYNNQDYTIKKNTQSGKYEAFDSEGNKVDSSVQINNGLTVIGFIEIGGLDGLNAGEALYIGTDPNGVFSMIVASAELDKNDAVDPECGSHLATLLEKGVRVNIFIITSFLITMRHITDVLKHSTDSKPKKLRPVVVRVKELNALRGQTAVSLDQNGGPLLMFLPNVISNIDENSKISFSNGQLLIDGKAYDGDIYFSQGNPEGQPDIDGYHLAVKMVQKE